MEYCPELAVLQSAFQLIDKQTNGRLSELSKVNCGQYIKIIVSAVNEICTGIEYDLDSETRKQWQQKLHCLIFYTLMKRVYYTQKVTSIPAQVPVQSSLDMLSQLLPAFSSDFYFELVKECDWTTHFLQCLQSLNKTKSLTVLSDFLSYCQQEPVSEGDNRMMTIFTDKILARCLCVPDRPSELCEDLLKPLNHQSKYVTVIHSDSIYDEVTKVPDDKTDCDNITTVPEEVVGVKLFDEFVKLKPDLFNLIISHFDKRLSMSVETSLIAREDGEITQILTQLAVWLYLFKVREENSCPDWFTNNVFLSENEKQLDRKYENELVYSLNYSLMDQLCCHGDKMMLLQTVEKIIKISDFKLLPPRSHIVNGLSVHSIVLLRMLEGIMGKDETSDMHAGIKDKFNVDEFIEDNEIILGETWNSDVTLEALLWRIGGRLYKYEDCVALLLDKKCLNFWMTDRLHHVILQNTSIFNQPDHVLQLSNILTLITHCSPQSREITTQCSSLSREITTQCSTQSRERISSMIKLLETSFIELPFPDKDYVIKQIYVSGSHYISDVIKVDMDERVTNVLNKVTVDLSDQILDEIMYLCIGDPMYVIKSTLMLSIYNEQQAISCAKILQVLYKTCQCKHPVNHPDITLLSLSIYRYISTHTMTSKQQLNFMVFISEILEYTDCMKRTLQYKPGYIISPEEFILTSILPTLSGDNLEHLSEKICFCLSLLVNALQALLIINQRDVTSQIEPVPLLVILAEIQHRCLVVSPVEELGTSNVEESFELLNPSKTAPTSTSTVTMTTKLNIRKKIDDIKLLFVELSINGYFTMDRNDVRWMLYNIKDLHLMVKLGIYGMTWGYIEHSSDDFVTLETCMKDWKTNMLTILQYVAVGSRYIDTIYDNIHGVDITCDQLILALVQLLPQCIDSEFDNILCFIEQFMLIDRGSVRMLYKLQSTHCLPLIDYTVIKPQLYSSQLLMYVMITLTLTLKEKPWQQRSLLQTLISSYVRYIKMKCEKVTSLDKMTSLIYLNEIFHHVSRVTLQLPDDMMDSPLILLLHIQTQYLSCCQDTCESVIYDDHVKLRNNLDNTMIDIISSIPGNSEHRHMLLKKLKE
ncbi:hypothetical protein ACF0H5_022211 [Mactra antiquata]